jgi:ABC-type siderophore export system fused ATPase/permease subunit
MVKSIISAFVLLITGYAFNRPNNYMAIGAQAVDIRTEQQLAKLIIYTRMVSFLQVAGHSWFIYSVSTQDNTLSTITNIIAWFVLFVLSDRLNQPQNAYQSGHYSIFVSLLFLLSNQFDQYQIYKLEVLIAQLLLSTSLICIYGFWWSHRSESDEDKNVSQEEGASIFAKLFFTWTTSLIKLGAKHPLKPSDIWGLSANEKAGNVLIEYRSVRREQDYLGKRLIKLSITYILYQLLCGAITTFLSYSGPYYLFKIITLIQNPKTDRVKILTLLINLLGFKALSVLANGQLDFTAKRVGTRSRVALIDELYKKSLHRVQSNSTDNEQASLGKIVTLMSVDTEQIRNMFSSFQDALIALPLSFIISLSSLYFILGYSTFAGISVMLVVGPISTHIGKSVLEFEKKVLENTDRRVHIINEVLQGIRLVKYMGWETHFIDRIGKAREDELDSMVNLWIRNIGIYIISSATSILITLTTFFVYTFVEGKVLDVATAFTAINLLNIVSQLLTYFPYQIMQILKGKVSIDRIAKFLEEEDIDPHDFNELEQFIGFKNAEFSYYGANEFRLKHLNVIFPPKKLSLVIGITGSGKSSLILALLGGILYFNRNEASNWKKGIPIRKEYYYKYIYWII